MIYVAFYFRLHREKMVNRGLWNEEHDDFDIIETGDSGVRPIPPDSLSFIDVNFDGAKACVVIDLFTVNMLLFYRNGRRYCGTDKPFS